jgi:hypothetical protein
MSSLSDDQIRTEFSQAQGGQTMGEDADDQDADASDASDQSDAADDADADDPDSGPEDSGG